MRMESIIETSLEILLKYWALITGAVALLVGAIKYLNNKAKNEERHTVLLESISKSNESMDISIKRLMDNFNVLNTEIRLLRNDYENLLDDHKELSLVVKHIKGDE